MLVPILLFVLGLILLIKGGDWFVDGATGIAHRFRLPEILIGATVVSIGTTLPEVMVSATSAVSGHGEMAYGNAIGSVICNTALIAALTVAIRPSEVERKTLILPVTFFFIAAAVYAVVAYATGYFSRWVGTGLLAIFAAYMVLSVTRTKKTALLDGEALKTEEIETAEAAEAAEIGAGEKTETAEAGAKRKRALKLALARDILLLVAGAVLIAIGADLLVDNGTIIAEKLGVPEAVIAITFLALGTSLPELVTAITSLAKGHGSLSLGNVIGANLFNLVLVSGVAAVLSPFSVPNNAQIAGINSSLLIDIPVMLFVMAFLTLPALKREKLSRAQGIVLLAVYAAFCAVQFIL